MHTIYHALVLNFHQPAGNLEELLINKPWETQQILYALDRMPRTLWAYEDVARVHLSLSGTLLETLADPKFQQLVYGYVDCGSLLWQLQNNSIFNILGTGYYHPVLPLIPKADHEEHLRRWRGIAEHKFGRSNFEGFWPPEMSFSMELIPLIKRMGFQYVLVDSDNVVAVTAMTWGELRYRPHIAKYGNDEIIVIVRDRELSNAQESGMNYSWFAHEVYQRTQDCNFPPLVTTCSDGDNGGWFRNFTEGSNFWSGFYVNLLDVAKENQPEVLPTFIHDYIKQHGVHGEVSVNTAAWNTGWHDGKDFIQWTGSKAQKDALEKVRLASKKIHNAYAQTNNNRSNLEQAMWHLLRAETSCNFYWGEARVNHCNQDIEQALKALHLS